jgi:signal transduction histidine kinase
MCFVLSGDTPLFATAVIGAVWIVDLIRMIADISKLEKQIDGISGSLENGDSTPKTLKRGSVFYSMSRSVSELSEGFRQAVEKQVQSEKMKVELVTNVSHDLKTPLTSIISYIDLLEKTDLPDDAADYVKILSRKSEKLSEIVCDVFSLAKATSGVDVKQEELDLAILLRQVLADNCDKTENCGRAIKTEISVDRAPIIGDGAKLYRVIQNLLDNAVRYSLDGTRIYFSLTESHGNYTLEVKNVSAYEMNFTAEEITERFARGDKSRTDGGNGLGLSIAKSFTESCGGQFEVAVDGDVFKAIVKFPIGTEKRDYSQ